MGELHTRRKIRVGAGKRLPTLALPNAGKTFFDVFPTFD